MEMGHDAARAKKAIETVKMMLTKERYIDASKCIKMAMEIYPATDLLKEYGFGLLIISETLHYGNIYLSKCDRFDLYSVLHVSPSSTHAEVVKRFKELKKEVIKIKNTMPTFPGVKHAEYLLSLANAILHYKALRAEFDSERKDCVFLDWPASSNKTAVTLRETYLNWKPPVYHVDATEYVKSRILKRKKEFDEMPQNPHYITFGKPSKKVCQCMFLGSEFGFIKLCEEIRSLVDIQSFWKALDGFNEQLSQLKEMGYNVEKVSKRIDILKGIADSERASRAAAEKFEDEVRDEEAKVINLQAAIKEVKDMIANRKSKIEALKKDSSDAIVKFMSIAKSKWV